MAIAPWVCNVCQTQAPFSQTTTAALSVGRPCTYTHVRNKHQCCYLSICTLLSLFWNERKKSGALLSELRGALLSELRGALFSELRGALLSELRGALLSELSGALLSELRGALLSELSGALLSELRGALLSELPSYVIKINFSLQAISSFKLLVVGLSPRRRGSTPLGFVVASV